MIRVLIVDDHPVVRRGLKQIIDHEEDMATAGEAGDGHGVAALVASSKPDVVVLDLSMPGMSGIEVLARLRADHPALPVLILSAQPADEMAVRALRAGASGYLNKEMAPEELVIAVRRVASGRKYVTEALGELLADSLRTTGQPLPHTSLSDREYQVLLMIGSGKTVSEIAYEIGLSVKTASTYRTRILEKMSLRNNAELMHYVIRHSLTPNL